MAAVAAAQAQETVRQDADSNEINNLPVLFLVRLPIPLRLLLAAQPKLVTPVLRVVHRVITRHLLGQAGLKPDEADSGAVTLFQRFVSRQLEHPPALPGAGRGVPTGCRRHAGI